MTQNRSIPLCFYIVYIETITLRAYTLISTTLTTTVYPTPIAVICHVSDYYMTPKTTATSTSISKLISIKSNINIKINININSKSKSKSSNNNKHNIKTVPVQYLMYVL